MLELYDRTAPRIWSYALHRTGSKVLAKQVTIAAFLTAAERPQVFDGRISVTARMLLILHLQTGGQHWAGARLTRACSQRRAR